MLLHVKTTKGKGYPPAEAASDKYHGVAKFDVATGKQKVRNSYMLLFFLLLFFLLFCCCLLIFSGYCSKDNVLY